MTQLILDWLDSPSLGVYTCQPVSDGEETTVINLPLCAANNFGSVKDDLYFAKYADFAEINEPREQWQFDDIFDNCTVDSLKNYLQIAVELEFSTILPYMTTLYSIAPGCNTEVYRMIRSILMQEMLHMAQAANILIALGGRPIIDSKDKVPHFPSKGLPGGVLPELNVTLQRASRQHIQDVLMAMEFPQESNVAMDEKEIKNSTIGHFYRQVNTCISELTVKGIKLFNDNTSHLQLRWPWSNNATGELYIIESLQDVLEGLKNIIEQGEGASPIEPEFEKDELAHFYKFQQIVCTKALVKINDTHYDFVGHPIELDARGIYPMRNNPSKNGITKGTQAYYEARAFHQIYRNLLRKLQQVFDGEPEKVFDTVSIMESLLVHAKRVMRTKLDVNNPKSETVGPVFDYEWEE